MELMRRNQYPPGRYFEYSDTRMKLKSLCDVVRHPNVGVVTSLAHANNIPATATRMIGVRPQRSDNCPGVNDSAVKGRRRERALGPTTQ